MAPLALPFRPPASAEGFISCRRGKEIEWKNAGQSPPGRRGGPGVPGFRRVGRCWHSPRSRSGAGLGWWSWLGHVRVSVSVPPSPPCAGGAALFWDGRFCSKVILEGSVLLYDATAVIFPFSLESKGSFVSPSPPSPQEYQLLPNPGLSAGIPSFPSRKPSWFAH